MEKSIPSTGGSASKQAPLRLSMWDGLWGAGGGGALYVPEKVSDLLQWCLPQGGEFPFPGKIPPLMKLPPQFHHRIQIYFCPKCLTKSK